MSHTRVSCIVCMCVVCEELGYVRMIKHVVMCHAVVVYEYASDCAM